MFEFVLRNIGVCTVSGAGVVVGVGLLADLVFSALADDVDDAYTRVHHGEIVEVDR
ncbi:hypothetical protein [Gordonia oryzae]|uniref:hypothetical protein n=1 Tax=Gordonia oryzae TaxID=2487349 RepID=UPI00161B6962|nr:hypothetical protein [Gordonia oryzae]